jgi:hexosaminidase
MRKYLFFTMLNIIACNLPTANKFTAEVIAFPQPTENNKEPIANEAVLLSPRPISIIPQPKSVTPREGAFIFNNKTTISVPSDETWHTTAAFFQQKIQKASGFDVPILNDENSQSIEFQQDASIINPEAYSLDITKKQIIIKAASAKGAFYGVQTLLQLMPDVIEGNKLVNMTWAVQCCNIWDEPRYAWRGMHLDVGRHFFGTDFIKKYLDLMAMHKFNRFHWHLTEDQGWRIEIKKYPKLTEVGAYREGTLIDIKNGEEHYDGQRYGGFYTQEQIQEIVQYAADRFITVVPEIEMPGHCLAALAAYPELACDEGPFKTATKWGGFRPVFCPKEETFRFIEDVLTEVMTLFPSEYIHIGGDEVKKESWEESDLCQNLIKKEKLENEEALQSYFVRRIEKFLNQKGRKLIGWDEILEGGLSDNATVMSWRGVDGGITAAKEKHDVIMSPDTYCYFNFYQNADKENEPKAMGKVVSVKKVYNYDPTPDDLMPNETKHILGAQGNVWTEYMRSSKDVEYMVFPRAIALAEVVWTAQDQRVWTEFKPRLVTHLKRLDVVGVNYAKHILK